jgi:hypothetical protein
MGIFASANQTDYFSQRKASNTTEVGGKPLPAGNDNNEDKSAG